MSETTKGMLFIAALLAIGAFAGWLHMIGH
jgi:hypothetical protein